MTVGCVARAGRPGAMLARASEMVGRGWWATAMRDTHHTAVRNDAVWAACSAAVPETAKVEELYNAVQKPVLKREG